MTSGRVSGPFMLTLPLTLPLALGAVHVVEQKSVSGIRE